MILSKIVEVKTGLNTSRIKDSDEHLNVFTRKDFQDNLEKLVYNRNCKTIIINNHTSKAIVIETKKMISQNFTVLTLLSENINPYYLMYLINESDEVRKQINLASQGSTIMIKINKKDLENLEINIAKEQELIGNIYANYTILKNLNNMEKKLHNLFINTILKERMI